MPELPLENRQQYVLFKYNIVNEHGLFMVMQNDGNVFAPVLAGIDPIT